MSLHVHAATSLQAVNASLVVVAVPAPFDRTAADLGLPIDVAERLIREAKRVGFAAELGETVLVSADGETPWYAIVGAGPTPQPTTYRRVASRVVKLAKQLKVGSAALDGAGVGDRARFATEGAILTAYRFDRHKAAPPASSVPTFEALTLIGEDAAEGVTLGSHTAAGVVLGRDLANEHPGACTPEFLASEAEAIAQRHGMQCTIRREEQLAAEGFNLLLAVGKGSANQPRLIHLVYTGAGTIEKRIALVGKGITYDSGGYSMKPSASQVNMHLDMGGSAAVLGAAEAIGRTKPEGVEVHFIVPAAENMVSAGAYKVMEIVTGYAGISVEVLNTDAEGRLVLADGLAYALEQSPDEIIDLATLTGACVVALGTETAGVFSNDDAFARRMLDTATAVDESMWHMPLTERIADQLKSDFADTKNIGSRWGGAISAALFLQKFVGDHTWMHIDLAGPAMTEAEWEYINKGGTGFGVIALHDYVASTTR